MSLDHWAIQQPQTHAQINQFESHGCVNANGGEQGPQPYQQGLLSPQLFGNGEWLYHILCGPEILSQ